MVAKEKVEVQNNSDREKALKLAIEKIEKDSDSNPAVAKEIQELIDIIKIKAWFGIWKVFHSIINIFPHFPHGSFKNFSTISNILQTSF